MTDTLADLVTTSHEPASRSLLARLRWLVPVAFLALTAWLVWHEFDSFDRINMQSTLLAVPTLPALGIAALALLGVSITGLVDVLIARWLGLKVPTRELMRLAFVANSMANTLNLSGAVGSGVRLLGLNSLRIDINRTAALIGMQVLTLWLGLSLMVILTLATSHFPITGSDFQHVVAIIVLAAVALYLPLYFVLTTQRALMRWLPSDQGLPPLLLKIQLTWVSFFDWLLAAAVLYACLYLCDAHVKPGLLLSTFTGASVLGLASMIPGGLGVFDGLMLVAMSEAGYDQPSVLSGLILFRITYYLLPLLGGLYLGSGMLARRIPGLSHLAERLREHPLFGVIGLPASLFADLGMRLLAVLTFGAGAMQLVSAALPSVSEHIELVREHLPMVAVESSAWFSVLSGVLLLGLARGIDGRLRVAYRLTQWLLLINSVLAITKGLHFGEALFLLAVAALLRTRKRAFTHRAMSLTSATTMGWYSGLILCVLVFFALGVLAVLGDDSFDMFYFGFGEHSSRMARGVAAALLGLVIYTIWQAFAVKRPKLALPTRRDLEQAREIYQAHGGGEFAHLSFVGDKHLFSSRDHHSIVAYGAVRDRLVALGSPCGPEQSITRAILDFRKYADSQDRVPVFYEVLEPDLFRYHDLGFDLFKLGELALVHLTEFTLAGKRWEDLRQAVNRSVKEQLSFELIEPPFDATQLAEIKRVSDAWLDAKGTREKGFSLGHYNIDYLNWSPIALVRCTGKLIAFANVLPPYGPNGTASVDLMRHVANAPRGTMDFLFAKVMQWAKDQGYQQFSLGMAPLSRVGDNPYARINERLAALAFQYGNKLYNYQGLRRYKEKFNPQWIGAYLAYPRGIWVPSLLIDIAALVDGGYPRWLGLKKN